MTLTLSPVELRVLGSLIEKERATPQGYPLTGNSLRLACNQSSNRQPVVDYDDLLIETTVAGLKEQGLLRFVYSPSNRATKYRHVLDEALRLSDDELAVLCVLFLRGPQTVGEIKGRTERLHKFDDLADVESTLRRLSERDDGALVRRLERQPGQKDARWAHQLGGDAPVDEPFAPEVATTAPSTAPPTPTPAPTSTSTDEEERVAALERVAVELRDELEALRAELEALRAELEDLRHQLGD
jgi:uncharacterized protein YceH (UPF0502 family)